MLHLGGRSRVKVATAPSYEGDCYEQRRTATDFVSCRKPLVDRVVFIIIRHTEAIIGDATSLVAALE